MTLPVLRMFLNFKTVWFTFVNEASYLDHLFISKSIRSKYFSSIFSLTIVFSLFVMFKSFTIIDRNDV